MKLSKSHLWLASSAMALMLASGSAAQDTTDQTDSEPLTTTNAYGFVETVEADLNVTTAASTQITVGQKVRESFGAAGNVDVYRISIKDTGYYVFSLIAAIQGDGIDPRQLDTNVKLYGADGDFLKSFNFPQVPFFNNVFQARKLEAGEYYVTTQSTAYPGAYDFAVLNAGYGDDAEADDVTTNAAIKPGQKITSALQARDDKDWFRFKTGKAGVFGFALKSVQGDVEIFNPIARVYNEEGSLIRENIAYAPPSLDAQVIADLPAGTYFIEAASLFDFGFGPYTLEALRVNEPGDDIGASTQTARLLEFGQPSSGALDYSLDQDWFRISVGADDVYPATGEVYFNLQLKPQGDANIQLFDLVVYDAKGARTDTKYALTDRGIDLALAEGEYFLSVESGPNILAGYTLQANPFEITSRNPLDTLISREDLAFDPAGGDGVISYYFYNEGEETSGEAGDTVYTAEGWTEYQRRQMREAIAEVASYIGVRFEEADSADGADVRFITNSTFNSAGGAFAYNEDTSEALRGLILLAPGQVNGLVTEPGGGMERGGLGYYTIVHEIVHVLGLAHAFDNFGSSDVLPGVVDSLDLGAFGFNQSAYTVLSYGPAQQDRPNPGNAQGYASSPMALDLGVLQARYGVNPSTGAGDTVYTLPETNALGTSYSAIWDAGGTDEIKHDGSASARIDLRPATLKYEIGGGGYLSQVDEIVGGYTIAAGVVIEKATGGSGDDALIGNDADNVLRGNSGSDSLTGGAGADIFEIDATQAGVDVIADFEPRDRIAIVNWTGMSVDDILTNAQDTESGLLIKINEQTAIYLAGVSKSDLERENIIFP